MQVREEAWLSKPSREDGEDVAISQRAKAEGKDDLGRHISIGTAYVTGSLLLVRMMLLLVGAVNIDIPKD